MRVTQLHTITAFIMALYLAVLSITMEPQEFVHVPELVKHYTEHKAAKQSVGIIEFFGLHYGAGAKEHNRTNDPAHSSLPLRSRDVHGIAIEQTYLDNPCVAMFIPEQAMIYSDSYHCLYPQGFQGAIFQPPKV